MNCDTQEIASSKMILDSLGPTLNQIKENVGKDVSNNDEKSVEINDVDTVKDVEMNGDVETKMVSVSTQTDVINLNEVSANSELIIYLFCLTDKLQTCYYLLFYKH